MDLIKHSYHLGMEGFRYGEAHVRYNFCLFTISATLVLNVAHFLALLLVKWVGNMEMSLCFCFIVHII